MGTCAERVAFGNAVFASPPTAIGTASSLSTAGRGGRVKVKGVAVASDKSPGVSPCGMCRQLYVPFFLVFFVFLVEGVC